MDRSIKTTLMNMCMIYDKESKRVLVQDKQKKKDSNWFGYTFPGGHVEKEESLMTSVIREVKEETGLDIKDVAICGVIDWENIEKPERVFVFLYKTSHYTGELLEETKEGKIFWMDLENFLSSELASNMKTYMELFLKENICEAYATWEREKESEFWLF